MSFLPKCGYHKLLIGDIKELLQKRDTFCFNYQQVYCLYNFFENQISGKINVKKGQLFENVQSAVQFNHQARKADTIPSITKWTFVEKVRKKQFLNSFQHTKPTQTSGSVFADRAEQVKKSKFELEPIKTVNCLIDSHGNYASNLVSFKI